MSNWLDLNSQHFLPILHNIQSFFTCGVLCALVQDQGTGSWFSRIILSILVLRSSPNYKSRNNLFNATITATNSNLPSHMPAIWVIFKAGAMSDRDPSGKANGT